MSQDHLINYLAGLKFIHKFVDNVYLKPTSVDAGFKIIDKVQEITYRLITFVASEKDISANPVDMIDGFGLLGKIKKSSWFISNPVTGKTVANGGYLTFLFSYPIATIGKSITGIDFDYGWQITRENGTTSKLKDWVREIWWESYSDNFLKSDVNAQMVSWAVALSGSWNHARFANWAEGRNYPWFELMYAVLNDHAPIISQSQYEQWLAAPSCSGTRYPNSIIVNYYVDTFILPVVFNSFEDKEDLKRQIEEKEEYLKGIYGNCEKLDSEEATSHIPFNRNSIFSMPNRSPLDDAYHWGEYNGVDYMMTYLMYRIAKEKYWKTTLTDFSDNQCPCAGSNFNLIKPILKNNNGTSITNLTSVYNTIERNLRYSELGIYTPEYLLHNLAIDGGGILNVKASATFCNVTIEVNSGGEIFIESPVSSNFFKKLIVNQSTLELKNNSKVEVGNNCTVVISENSKLGYSPGARIILNGPNAVLYIKGKLELAPGATFQIEGGPAGKGYVVWDCGDGSPHYGRASLQAGAGSKMVFKQNDNNKLALEVRGFSGMYLPNTLQSFTADSCRINLKEQALIACNAQFARFNKVDVYGHNEAHSNPAFNFKPSSRGIQVWAQKNEFAHVRVYDCLEAISIVNLWGVNQPLKLKNVTLINNQTGIRNHGGRIIWEDGLINDDNISGKNGTTVTQLRSGITGIGTQGASFLQNVTISVDDYTWLGVNNANVRFSVPAATTIANIWDHGTGRYYLTKCKLENAKYGSIMNQSFLFPLCSEYMNNKTGISIMQGSRMVAERGAWNRFSWNTADAGREFFRGVNGVNIYLDSGRNYIKGLNNLDGNYFLYGHIHQSQPLAPSDGRSGPNTQAIMARGNQWAIGGISNRLRTTSASDACASLLKFNNNAVVAVTDHLDINYTPQYSGGNWDTDQQSACSSMRRLVPGTLGSEWPINQGVITKLTAMGGYQLGQMVKQMSDDLVAEFNQPVINYPELIRKASNLFNAPLPIEVGADVFEVYSRVHTLYPMAFTDTTIPAVSRQTILNSIHQEMNTMQDRLIARADGSEPVMWTEYRFAVHRDKALIQRAFSQRPQSIMQLSMAIPTFSRPNDIQSLEAWHCLIQKEQAWLDSLIPYWMVNLDTCLMNFDSFGRWDSTYSDQWNPEGNRMQRMEISTKENNPGDVNMNHPQNLPGRHLTESDFMLNIRPNPTEGLLKLSMRGQPSWVEIINAQGQLLQKINRGAPEMELQIGHLPDGVYVIRVVHAKGVNTATVIKRSE